MSDSDGSHVVRLKPRTLQEQIAMLRTDLTILRIEFGKLKAEVRSVTIRPPPTTVDLSFFENPRREVTND